MFILSVVLQILLGLTFLLTGAMKATGAKLSTDHFHHFGLPRWFMHIAGLVELLGAVGMLVGIWLPFIAVLAGTCLGITMISAVLTHIFLGRDPVSKAAPAALFLLFSLAIFLINWHALIHVLFA